jgi:hypothetical protein
MPVSAPSHALIAKVLDAMPMLHFWNGEFSLGGFDRHVLGSLFWEIMPKLPERPVIVETGAGLTTLCFLAALPAKLVTVSVDPDGGLEGRIRQWCTDNEFPLDRLEYVNGYSELHLPSIGMSGLQADLCMIDGGHGWPTTMVDFCYLNMCLKQGGYLIIDDTQLYSVSQLVQLLKRQPGWRIHHWAGAKTVIFVKETAERMLPDFGGQPFILNNS